jgi:photosystem II stability/assembly factor-like uncharacterized protein
MAVLALVIFYFGSASFPWIVQTSGLDTNLRGVSAKCERNKQCVIWASGSNGVILRSIDEGKTWKQFAVIGAEDLDFRDIEAFDVNTAYVMSSGDGDKSRIYKTIDGGGSWKLQYSDQRPGFFLDSLACDSRTHCVALSDPVEEKFLVLSTVDGEHWKELPNDKMPAALPQEGAFAASGTAIALCEGTIFFGTGGPAARIFRSRDHGHSWTAAETPIASHNPSRGVFSLACASHGNVVAVGGDYKDPNRATLIAAYSKNYGQTWLLSQTQAGGYRSAIGSFANGDLAAVGPNGTDISHDKGVRWIHVGSLNLNAIGIDGMHAWAVGPKGTIADQLSSPFYRGRSGDHRACSSKAPSSNSLPLFSSLHLIAGDKPCITKAAHIHCNSASCCGLCSFLHSLEQVPPRSGLLPQEQWMKAVLAHSHSLAALLR